jgi:hypothetical protein
MVIEGGVMILRNGNKNAGRARRSLAFAFGLLAFPALAPISQPQPGPSAANVAIIKSVADLIGAIGDALGKLTDGVQKMIVAGDRGWTTIQARRTHASLINLSQLTTRLSVAQSGAPGTRSSLPDMLEDYLSDPTPEHWVMASDRIQDILVRVDTILARLDSERSDLVLQPAYAKLSAALQSRASVLRPLATAPPPTTPAERRELRRLIAAYRIMMAQLASARDELNAYIQGT